jgi:hypothetical protein
MRRRPKAARLRRAETRLGLLQAARLREKAEASAAVVVAVGSSVAAIAAG